MPDCLFCKIAAKEIPSQFVYEDPEAVVFNDINPQAATHVLVVPRRHIPRLSESQDSDAALLGSLQRVVAKVAGQLRLKSFRLVANNGAEAGQSVDHLHYHILAGRPFRWPPG